MRMVIQQWRFFMLALLLILTWSRGAESAGRLIVFTTDYCPYCKEFMQTVAPTYPKTDLGKRYPLVVVDNFAPAKEWEALSWEIRFYPTFLVMDVQGRELGRFRGYRGEEPFWSELERIVSRNRAVVP
ncbi:MAG: thioredoxin family protein [Magnetococcales bacterium]|nr:thioredoxin family protein [Magnetococcales bacterium]